MVPAGYMAKRVVARPDWLPAERVSSIYSVSGCVSETFADYINFWKHNGYWLFNSPEVIIEVEDAGPGLEPADIASTFERGALHAKYREVRSVGTGLGLSIAHRLATRMGAQLDVRSTPPRGAIFSIHVPIR